MKLSEYDYNLPDEYIAQTPIEPRDHSKLMIINSEKKEIQDNYFYNIIDQLTENDVLVLNKTKVINARLH
jgi:S-adenosylmethionine:tRNA ribosyltransferase-isomerase